MTKPDEYIEQDKAGLQRERAGLTSDNLVSIILSALEDCSEKQRDKKI